MEPYNLESEHLQCYPYARGYYNRRDLLHGIWAAIENAGDWDKILWDRTQTDTPISTHGDLVDWVNFVHSGHDPKVLLIFQDKASGELAGIVWFHRIEHGEAAACIWVVPKFRRSVYPREMVDVGRQYAFYAMGWTKVWAMTPWSNARNLSKRCGFKDVITLPKMYRVNGEPGDVYILAMEEQDYGRR